LLRGPHPVVVCLARSLAGIRLPVAWREPLSAGRLLIVSGVQKRESRVTGDLAWERSLLVAALAEWVLVLHAEAGSSTAQLCQTVLDWGKPVFTLDSPANAELVALGAAPIAPDRARIEPALAQPSTDLTQGKSRLDRLSRSQFHCQRSPDPRSRRGILD
jgi:predicted Rossmann fold nucleotide-binding protein DprA/Smf involved in DNA uptake